MEASISRIEKESIWSKVVADATLIIITVPTAVAFWLGSSRRIGFLRAMAVSAVLWTALIVIQELTYVSSSFVVTIWEAQMLSVITQFVTLQIWLLAFIPKPTGIGKGRCWLIGNGAFVLLQGVVGLIALKLVRLL